ncbi:hypothetical protein [Methanomethylophilus alvi]|uniref:hypothetical protein n=1 Tax=Methanomethylophilus alvi TaxID=1291540 RepID=UPI0037DD8EA0
MPAGIFDPVPLTFRDGRYLGQDNIGWDIVESAVSLLSTLVFLNERNGYMYERKLMELKEAERITFQRLRIKSLDTYGTASSIDAFEDGINCRYGGDFDDASVDNACKLAAYALTSGGAGRYAHPSRIRANDHTCENIRIMVRRTVGFFANMGPVTRIGFDMPGGYGGRITEGYGNYLTGSTVWDMTTSTEPLPKDKVLQLLVRYVMCRHSDDPEIGSVTNMGLVNPRLNCAYIVSGSRIDPSVIEHVEKEIVGYRPDLTVRVPINV